MYWAQGDGRLSHFRQWLTLLGTFSAFITGQPIELPRAVPGSPIAREFEEMSRLKP
jgi:hypothetical protein